MDNFSDTTARRRVRSQDSLHASAGILHKVIPDVLVSGLDKKSAELMLVSIMEEGSFIIRGGQDNCGFFTLSMCFLRNDQLVVLHMMIVIESDFDTGNTWYWISRQPRDSDTFEEESRNALRFATLEELRAYYKTPQGTVHHGGVLPTRLTKELNPRDIDATTMEELTLQTSPPLTRSEHKTVKNSQKLRVQWEKEKSKGTRPTSLTENKSPGLMRRLSSFGSSFTKKKPSQTKDKDKTKANSTSDTDNDTINITFNTDDNDDVFGSDPNADDVDDKNYVDTESDLAEALANESANIENAKQSTTIENENTTTIRNTNTTTIVNDNTTTIDNDNTTTIDNDNTTAEFMAVEDTTTEDTRVKRLSAAHTIPTLLPGEEETGYVGVTATTTSAETESLCPST